jgi:hypothetical protein
VQVILLHSTLSQYFMVPTYPSPLRGLSDALKHQAHDLLNSIWDLGFLLAL